MGSYDLILLTSLNTAKKVDWLQASQLFCFRKMRTVDQIHKTGVKMHKTGDTAAALFS